MRLEQITFHQDPAVSTARLLIEEQLDPVATLVVAPTQRFKTYLARALLEGRAVKSIIPPRIVSSSDLMGEIGARSGKPQANAMQKLTLLHRACEETPEVSELYPREFLGSYGSFVKVAKRLLKTFDELSREEIDISHHLGAVSAKYPFLKAQMEALYKLWRRYCAQQKAAGVYDAGFVLGSIGPEEVLDYFNRVRHILLISPLSLTRIEKRLFGYVNDRLTVIYQDTEDYDFSRVLSFRNTEEVKTGGGREQGTTSSTGFYRASSRIEQVLLMVYLIRGRISRGVDPRDIAVVNSDSQSAAMLYDMLGQLGIEVNYAEGLAVASSPIYQFLQLLSRVFSSRLDSEALLQLLQSEFFAELLSDERRKGWRTSCEEIRRMVLHRRIFRFESLKNPLLEKHAEMIEVCDMLQHVYASKAFAALYDRLEAFFARLSGRKTYDFYMVKDAVLDRALELQDLSLPFTDRPMDILLQSLRGDRFALQGVYSRGVQIVGLLESRAIGFHTVIVPSFNEGYFPRKRENDILLPADIRDLFGLPTLLDREELAFYYLKRIVDRALDVSFITLNNSRGEIDVMSRYAHLFCRKELAASLEPRRALPVWGADIRQRRREADKPVLTSDIQRFSRMDIARLKGCEAQYYIASRLGIHEYEELRRGIEPFLVGQRVHLIFNDLYRNVDYERLDPALLEHKLGALIDRHFEEGLFFSREEDLVKRMLRDKLRMSLRQDVARFREGYRVRPDFIEKTLEADLHGGRYRIWGRIDRVDVSPDGSFVLIDYKTGHIPSDKAHFEESEYSEVQLGFYGLLLKHAVPDAAIESLCYFDVSGDSTVKPVVEGEQLPGYLAGFEKHLVEFLDRFNAKSELSLAADLATCTYCPYDAICRIGET